MAYDHKIAEKKWQKYWEENKTFQKQMFMISQSLNTMP